MVSCRRCHNHKDKSSRKAKSRKSSSSREPGITEEQVREIIEEMREEWVEEDNEKFETMCAEIVE